MFRYSLFTFCFLSVIFLYSKGQTENRRKVLVKTIDSILQYQVSNSLIPGAVVLVKKDNNVIYRQAYGYARKTDCNNQAISLPEKMTIYHLFDIASLTKVIGTTTALMYLAGKQQLAIDDPVSKYVKGFATQEKRGITIRHLLTHTSGLYEWYPLYYRSSSKQETFSLISSLPLRDSVGKHRRYSDLGFTVLGQIIEVVSGMPLDQFLRQKIFAPLGMHQTLYNPLKNGWGSKIAPTSFGNPYEKRMVYDSSLGFTVKDIDPASWNGWRNYVLAGEVNDGNAWYANGGVSGAAGLFSTVNDIQRMIDLLLNKGILRDHAFIPAETINGFLNKDHFKNGLGWMMDPANSFMKNGPKGTFGHTGFTGTSIAVIPVYKASVILLVNRQHTGLSAKGEYYNLNPVRERIFKAVLQYCE